MRKPDGWHYLQMAVIALAVITALVVLIRFNH